MRDQEAWAASVAWVKRRGLPLERQDFHSLSWLAYAYLQQGRHQKARETLEIARGEARKESNPRIASAVQDIEARYAIETRPRWLSWLITPALVRMFSRDTCRRLAALKEAVEKRGLLETDGRMSFRPGATDQSPTHK